MRNLNVKLLYIFLFFGLLLFFSVEVFGAENKMGNDKDVDFVLSQKKTVYSLEEPVELDILFRSNRDNIVLYRHEKFGIQCSMSYFLFLLVKHEDGEILKYYNSGFPIPLLPTTTDTVNLNKGDEYHEAFDLRKYYRYPAGSQETFLKEPKILKLKPGKYMARAIYMYNFHKRILWKGSIVSNEINFKITE